MIEAAGIARELNVQPAMAMVEQYERAQVSAHPLFQSLRRGSVDLSAIWLLMANLRAGISRDFVVWLAHTIARVEDRRIGSFLAKQLNDELGNGDESAIHSVLLDRFVAALSRWRPSEAGEAVLRPGRELAAASSRIFFDSTPYEGVGALIVGEIFAKKMDLRLAEEIRRQSSIPDADLRWLWVHECLEVDHAEDSKALAALVPASGPALAASWRGGQAQWDILWNFLDGVEAIRRGEA